MNCAWPPGRCGGHHHPAGDRAGRGGAVLLAPQVQGGVEPGGRAGAGDDLAGVDVQHLGDDPGEREAGGELVGVLPVRGRLAAVEEAGLPEDEGARAHRQHAGAARDGVLQGPHDGDWGRGRRRAHRRDADQVGLGDSRSRPWRTCISKPSVVRTWPGSTPQIAKSRTGSPSSLRSTPKASQSTPSSNRATSSQTRTATLVSTSASMTHPGRKSTDICHCCHSWRDHFGRRITAMTTFALVLVLLALGALLVRYARHDHFAGAAPAGRRPRRARSRRPAPPRRPASRLTALATRRSLLGAQRSALSDRTTGAVSPRGALPPGSPAPPAPGGHPPARAGGRCAPPPSRSAGPHPHAPALGDDEHHATEPGTHHDVHEPVRTLGATEVEADVRHHGAEDEAGRHRPVAAPSLAAQTGHEDEVVLAGGGQGGQVVHEGVQIAPRRARAASSWRWCSSS